MRSNQIRHRSTPSRTPGAFATGAIEPLGGTHAGPGRPLDRHGLPHAGGGGNRPATAADRRGGWLAFWNGPRPIYVSERHRRVHYAKVADDILEVLPRPRPRVLDFGCGAALDAGRVARACERLYLCEAAETWRAELAARFRGHPGIEVIDPDGMDALPDGSLDLVVVNSVLQYVPRAEVLALLRRFRAKLAPQGLLVLADLLPERSSALADAVSLLRVALRHGFFPAALAGLLRLLVSDYRRLRREVGLTVFPPGEIARLLAEAGFEAGRRAVNFGFNQRRTTWLARRSAPVGLERPVAVAEEGPDHHEPGRDDLGQEIVQLQGTGEQRHEGTGQQEPDERHDHEPRHGDLVSAVAGEGPVAVEPVGDRPAHEEAEHSRQHRARAA